jgi:hypothetical protein
MLTVGNQRNRTMATFAMRQKLTSTYDGTTASKVKDGLTGPTTMTCFVVMQYSYYFLGRQVPSAANEQHCAVNQHL